ncbi:hypothetical protein AB0L30_28800 [Microbispora rosea]|uniref:hypothetical protein n=1 Tax=Microbispora rosea TaxID=58117 RepID=UPI00343F966E
MADEITAGRNAARALTARAPGWMVWYGERTGSFWAVPRAGTAIVPRMLEAQTADDLENEIRRAEGRPTREQTQSETEEAARHRRPPAETPAPRIPVGR